MARGGVARAELRPANFRLYRKVERLLKPLVKDEVVSKKAVANGERARRPVGREGPGLAMAIISTLMLLALGYICHCATCYVSMLEAEEYEALVHHFTGKRQPSRRSSERPEGGSVIIS